MVDPASGPFLFDTSAESWLARAGHPGATDWMRAYLSRHEAHVSVVTVLDLISLPSAALKRIVRHSSFR